MLFRIIILFSVTANLKRHTKIWLLGAHFFEVQIWDLQMLGFVGNFERYLWRWNGVLCLWHFRWWKWDGFLSCFWGMWWFWVYWLRVVFLFRGNFRGYNGWRIESFGYFFVLLNYCNKFVIYILLQSVNYTRIFENILPYLENLNFSYHQ